MITRELRSLTDLPYFYFGLMMFYLIPAACKTLLCLVCVWFVSGLGLVKTAKAANRVFFGKNFYSWGVKLLHQAHE